MLRYKTKCNDSFQVKERHATKHYQAENLFKYVDYSNICSRTHARTHARTSARAIKKSHPQDGITW